MPVGCNGLEDWLLDNVEVPKLMPLLKKGVIQNGRQYVHARLNAIAQDHQAAQEL